MQTAVSSTGQHGTEHGLDFKSGKSRRAGFEEYHMQCRV